MIRSVAARRAASFARFTPGLRHPGPALFGHIGSTLLKLPGFDDGSEEQGTLLKALVLGLSHGMERELEPRLHDATQIWSAVERGTTPNLDDLDPRVISLLGIGDARLDLRQLESTLRLAEIVGPESLADYLTFAIAGSGTGSVAVPAVTPTSSRIERRTIPGQAGRTLASKARTSPSVKATAKKARARQVAIPAGPLGQNRKARLQRRTPLPALQKVKTATSSIPKQAHAKAVVPTPPVTPVQAALPSTRLPSTVRSAQPAPALPTNVLPPPAVAPPQSPSAAQPRPRTTQPAAPEAPGEFIALPPASTKIGRKGEKPTAYEKALRFLKSLGK